MRLSNLRLDSLAKPELSKNRNSDRIFAHDMSAKNIPEERGNEREIFVCGLIEKKRPPVFHWLA
jgi:hypothetical protein